MHDVMSSCNLQIGMAVAVTNPRLPPSAQRTCAQAPADVGRTFRPLRIEASRTSMTVTLKVCLGKVPQGIPGR